MKRLFTTAGLFYLLTIITGMAGAFTRNEFISEALNLAAMLCYGVVTVLLYRLFRPTGLPDVLYQ